MMDIKKSAKAGQMVSTVYFLNIQFAVYTLNVRTKLASVGSQDPSQRPRPNPEIHSEIHPDEGSAPGRFVAYAGVEK
jgi:hypothetical protein